MDKNSPIGVFDSGIGGLTVLKKLVTNLPQENYIYFGDTARVPYGEKSKEQLLSFSIEILNWYKNQNVKAVLMACNTSSAVTLNTVKDEYDFPIFGLIQPAAKHIAKLDINKVGVIATSATIKSKAYSRSIFELNENIESIEIACPGLVEIVESGKLDSQEAVDLVSRYIMPILESKVDKIVLGCTHYPYLSRIINQITGNPEMLIDPADYLVKETEQILNKLDLLQKRSNNQNTGTKKYYVSSNPDRFVSSGSKFYSDCNSAEIVDVSLLNVK